jgi:hypothetical protein
MEHRASPIKEQAATSLVSRYDRNSRAHRSMMVKSESSHSPRAAKYGGRRGCLFRDRRRHIGQT